MKTLRWIPLVLIASLLAGCVSVPPSYQFGLTDIRTVGVLSVSCKKPFALSQDCSGLMGPTRRIAFEGTEIKIAGSADGTAVLMMAGSIGFKSHELSVTALKIDAFLTDAGLKRVDAVAGVVNNDLGALALLYDGDAYTLLTAFTKD